MRLLLATLPARKVAEAQILRRLGWQERTGRPAFAREADSQVANNITGSRKEAVMGRLYRLGSCVSDALHTQM